MSGARHKVNQLKYLSAALLISGSRRAKMRIFLFFLALDADHRLDAGDQLCQTRLNGTFHHERDVLIRAGCLLCDFTHRFAADENAPAEEFVDYQAPLPLTGGLMPAHGATGTVNSRAECIAFVGFDASENKRGGAHAAANQYRLTDVLKLSGQVRMGRAESSRGTFSVNVKVHEAAAQCVLLRLAGIMRDVVEQLEFGFRE